MLCALVGRACLLRGVWWRYLETDCLPQSSRGVHEPVSGFFGPLTLLQPRPAIGEDDLENVRKRQIEEEQLQNQTNGPVKRPRLSNGYMNGNGVDSTPRSPMDVDEDQNGDGNAYPSPEQLPSPVAATIGPERGTQVDKVSELGAETTSWTSRTRQPRDITASCYSASGILETRRSWLLREPTR